VTEQQKQALAYLTSVCSDYSATMPPSVRGPFVRETQAAINILAAEPEAPPTSPTPG